MYLEKRKEGKRTKYYLIHSYRDKGEVKKIRHYLGSDLSPEVLLRARQKAEAEISSIIDELSTEVFLFRLSRQKIRKLNQYSKHIRISHLDLKGWRRFTEEFVYNTNAIEGSTVRLDEVPAILEKKRAYDSEEKETRGVAEAVNCIRQAKKELSVPLIKRLHYLCFRGSKGFAGKLRDVEVVIKDREGRIIHRGVPASDVLPALEEMVSWYRLNKGKFSPLALAAIIHNQFEHIHPFQDGNGRVGRLLLNYVLIRKGYPPISISLEDRHEYYQTLQSYSRSQDIRPTLRFLVRQYDKTMKRVTTKKGKKG